MPLLHASASVALCATFWRTEAHVVWSSYACFEALVFAAFLQIQHTRPAAAAATEEEELSIMLERGKSRGVLDAVFAHVVLLTLRFAPAMRRLTRAYARRSGVDEALQLGVMQALLRAISGADPHVGMEHVAAAWKLSDERALAALPGEHLTFIYVCVRALSCMRARGEVWMWGERTRESAREGENE
jgi:hypothetical protein